MVTVAHLVKKLIKEKPFLEEALGRKIISYGNLAEQLKPKIDEELEKDVKQAAIVMALRRYSDDLESRNEQLTPFDYTSEIVMKTNVTDFCVTKSPDLLAKLKQLYSMVDFEKGDILHVILGNYEISIIISDKYKEKLVKFLKGSKVLNKEDNLVALSVRFKSDFFHTPGVIFNVVRNLAWENINIYEVVSTMTELTLILNKKDSMKAYESMQRLIDDYGKKKAK